MAYALAYCFHTWEMNALRGWGVAFLAFVAVSTGEAHPWIAPTAIAALFAGATTLAELTALGRPAVQARHQARLLGACRVARRPNLDQTLVTQRLHALDDHLDRHAQVRGKRLGT